MEPATTRVVESLQQPGMIFVDVGAAVGYYSLLAAPMVGESGHVYAFEPDDRVIGTLSENARLAGHSDRIRVVTSVVSDSPGRVRMFAAKPGVRDGSMYKLDDDSRLSSEVQVTSLDAYFAEQDWPRVDVIKIDIEGAEEKALIGMRSLVHRNRGLQLVVEFCPWILKRASVQPAGFFETLRDVSFNHWRVIDGDYATPGNLQPWGDLRRLDERPDVDALLEAMGADGAVNLFYAADPPMEG